MVTHLRASRAGHPCLSGHVAPVRWREPTSEASPAVLTDPVLPEVAWTLQAEAPGIKPRSSVPRTCSTLLSHRPASIVLVERVSRCCALGAGGRLGPGRGAAASQTLPVGTDAVLASPLPVGQPRGLERNPGVLS